MSWVFKEKKILLNYLIVLKVWYKKTYIKNRNKEKNLISCADVVAEVEDFET